MFINDELNGRKIKIMSKLMLKAIRKWKKQQQYRRKNSKNSKNNRGRGKLWRMCITEKLIINRLVRYRRHFNAVDHENQII